VHVGRSTSAASGSGNSATGVVSSRSGFGSSKRAHDATVAAANEELALSLASFLEFFVLDTGPGPAFAALQAPETASALVPSQSRPSQRSLMAKARSWSRWSRRGVHRAAAGDASFSTRGGRGGSAGVDLSVARSTALQASARSFEPPPQPPSPDLRCFGLVQRGGGCPSDADAPLVSAPQLPADALALLPPSAWPEYRADSAAEAAPYAPEDLASSASGTPVVCATTPRRLAGAGAAHYLPNAPAPPAASAGASLSSLPGAPSEATTPSSTAAAAAPSSPAHQLFANALRRLRSWGRAGPVGAPAGASDGAGPAHSPSAGSLTASGGLSARGGAVGTPADSTRASSPARSQGTVGSRSAQPDGSAGVSRGAFAATASTGLSAPLATPPDATAAEAAGGGTYSSSTAARIRGSQIGLPVADLLAEALGGRLHLYRDMDQRVTVFRAVVPLVPEGLRPHLQGYLQAQEAAAAVAANTVTVLVAQAENRAAAAAAADSDGPEAGLVSGGVACLAPPPLLQPTPPAPVSGATPCSAGPASTPGSVRFLSPSVPLSKGSHAAGSSTGAWVAAAPAASPTADGGGPPERVAHSPDASTPQGLAAVGAESRAALEACGLLGAQAESVALTAALFLPPLDVSAASVLLVIPSTMEGRPHAEAPVVVCQDRPGAAGPRAVELPPRAPHPGLAVLPLAPAATGFGVGAGLGLGDDSGVAAAGFRRTRAGSAALAAASPGRTASPGPASESGLSPQLLLSPGKRVSARGSRGVAHFRLSHTPTHPVAAAPHAAAVPPPLPHMPPHAHSPSALEDSGSASAASPRMTTTGAAGASSSGSAESGRSVGLVGAPDASVGQRAASAGSGSTLAVPGALLLQQPTLAIGGLAAAPLGLHVLVTDDERANRMIFGRFLERLGCTFVAVGEGDEATAELELTGQLPPLGAGGGAGLTALPAPLAKQPSAGDPTSQAPTPRGRRPFDVVFLDIVMCRTDGAQTCKDLRRRGLRLPVIAATGNRSCRQYFEAGFDHVMEKPFTQAVLLAVLREHVLAPQAAAAAAAAAAATAAAAPPDRGTLPTAGTPGNGGGSGLSAAGADAGTSATPPAFAATPADLTITLPRTAASRPGPPPFGSAR